MKKHFLCILVLFFFLFHFDLTAEEKKYQVVDYGSSHIAFFDSYEDAFQYYIDNQDNSYNLILKYEDKVLLMQYGIVSFNDEVGEYDSIIKEKEDYIGSSYLEGALYLRSYQDSVYFTISSDIGRIDYNKVELIPLNQYPDISVYVCRNGNLYHNIKTDVGNDFYSYSLDLGTCEDYFQENMNYYSFDGHYFYEDFFIMSLDYQNDTKENAINFENPYYNYYQYLPVHSYSNYSLCDIETLFYEKLNIISGIGHYIDYDLDNAHDEVNTSLLYGTEAAFVNGQFDNNVNMMSAIAMSIVDSSFGRSYESIYHNSLYQLLSFENDTERSTKRYESVDSSIESFEKNVMNDLYGNIYRSDYSGTYFGNRLSGIASRYSLDPYYGEKCASAAYFVDKTLGNRDYQNYALAIFSDSYLSIYQDEQLQELFLVLNTKEYSAIVLEECANSYRIQLEDFDCNFYVDKKSVSYILNIDEIKELQKRNERIDTNLIEENGNEAQFDNEIVYSFDDIRQMDLEKLKNNLYGYHINTNNLDISISGLASGLKFPGFNLIFGDTYYCFIDEDKKVKDTFTSLVNTYGYDIVESFNVSFKLNYSKIDLINPIVVSLKIEHRDNTAYVIYHIRENGIVEKCNTEWSNHYVRFIAREKGQYVLLKKESFNNYDLIDSYENINIYNNSVDNHRFIRETLIFFVIMIIDLILCVLYFIRIHIEENGWKGYKKSLLIAGSVLEEKQKN